LPLRYTTSLYPQLNFWYSSNIRNKRKCLFLR